MTRPLVIRADFDDQEKWERIQQLIAAPVHDGEYTFYADVDFLDDTRFRNATVEDLLARLPRPYDHSFVMIADKATLEDPEFPILVVDLHDQPANAFRAIPSTIQSIENNLSLANMDFYEFAESVASDGVFRGFPEP